MRTSSFPSLSSDKWRPAAGRAPLKSTGDAVTLHDNRVAPLLARPLDGDAASRSREVERFFDLMAPGSAREGKRS